MIQSGDAETQTHQPLRWVLACGALMAMLAVALGAFAAHGLKSQLDEYSLAIFNTAVDYQVAHSLGLLLIGALSLSPLLSQRWLNLSAVSLMLGTLIFSGSLYLLALSGLRWLGAITPIGGLLLILGWLFLLIAAYRKA